jgi:hypothetical protein
MLILIGFLSTGCSKQPTEIQKASIDNELLSCMISVNEDPKGDRIGNGFFETLTSLASNVDKISSKKWELFPSNGKEIINVTFSANDTKYSCDYIDTDEGYNLSEARRNGEKIYNAEENTIIIANKEERLAREKEELRLAEIKVWHEKGFSNVAYKYFEKRHIDSVDRFGETTLRAICDPSGFRIEVNVSNMRMKGERNVEFKFRKGLEATEAIFNLTSNGAIGKSGDDNMFDDTYVEKDLEETLRFISLFELSNSVEVKGVTFYSDNLGQIKCLEEVKDAS